MNQLTAMTSLCRSLTSEASLAHRPELACPPCTVRCSFAFVVMRVKLSLLPANSTGHFAWLRRMGTIIGKGLRPLQKMDCGDLRRATPVRPTRAVFGWVVEPCYGLQPGLQPAGKCAGSDSNRISSLYRSSVKHCMAYHAGHINVRWLP